MKPDKPGWKKTAKGPRKGGAGFSRPPSKPRGEGPSRPPREGGYSRPDSRPPFKPRGEGSSRPPREGGYSRPDSRPPFKPRGEGPSRPPREGGYSRPDSRPPFKPRGEGSSRPPREGGYSRPDSRPPFKPRGEGPSRPPREGGYKRPDDRGGAGFSRPPSKPRGEGPSRPPRDGGFKRFDSRPAPRNSDRDQPRADTRGPREDAGPAKARPTEPKDRPTKTLERVLSKAGLSSRTTARSWIHDRRVEVNGKVVENPDEWINLQGDKVTVDGRPLEAEKKIYLLLYKPKGFVTTAKDPDGRPTVYDLIQDVKTWIAPVGRLDLDTTGLLLLTNDTQLAERLTNPDHKVPKTYQLKVKGMLSDEQLDQLRNGLDLSDGPTRPAIVNRLRNSEKYSFIEMTITEGRNRQVRRMIEAIGTKVMKLTRVAIGPIRIDNLEVGRHRELTADELAAIEKSAAGE